MGPPDRAPGRDRQPDRPAQPVEVRPQSRPDRHRLIEERRFRFVQWELPGRLGPPPGRYVVRRYAGDDAQAIIVVAEGSAPRRVGRREPRDTVPVTRVTVIDADPIFDDATAAAWLRAVDGVPAFGPATLERLVRSFRVASADPFLADLDVARAWRTRVGYGSGDQVSEGEWTAARELEAPREPRTRRRAKERPTDRLAALLSGRDAILASEELALRARADLDLGRAREAALQLEAALSAALAELAGWRAQRDIPERLAELETHVEPVRGAAAAAREGTLDPSAVDVIAGALERLEAALRARAIYTAEGG